MRVPDHPVALALLSAFGGGVTAPSANRFGSVSPTTANHVRAELGDVDFVLDGGPCEVGVESTIVHTTGDTPSVLQPGGVTREALEAVLGHPLAVPSTSRVRELDSGGATSSSPPCRWRRGWDSRSPTGSAAPPAPGPPPPVRLSSDGSPHSWHPSQSAAGAARPDRGAG